VTRTLERELKFDVPEEFVLPGLDGAPGTTRNFVSTYLDTPDYRLAAADVTLRRRLENGRNLWQLKLPRGAGTRLELEEPGAPVGPPERFVVALEGILRGAELAAVARLRTRREVLVIDGAEVVLDEVAVLDGNRVRDRFRELEVEALTPGAKLGGLARELTQAGALESDGRQKVFRALGLPGRPPAPGADDPPSEHVRHMLREQLGEIFARDPAVRLGDDAEELHQLRVATRRLRSILRAAGPLVEKDWADGLRAELGWLGGILGPARDLDVLLERLRADATVLDPVDRRALQPFFRSLSGRRLRARRRVMAALRSERYAELVERLIDAAAAPRLVESEVTLKEIAAGQFHKLRRDVARLDPDPADAELHAVRIRGKRARYAAELAAGTVGKPAVRFIDAAKTFQDVVGEHQDAHVAEEVLREFVEREKRSTTIFAAGRLAERQRLHKQQMRAAFPDAWARLERRGRRAWK
jgi:CHAD domain-containing protein